MGTNSISLVELSLGLKEIIQVKTIAQNLVPVSAYLMLVTFILNSLDILLQ